MASLKKMKTMATVSEKEWIEERITATARLLHSLKPLTDRILIWESKVERATDRVQRN